jgi:hypothetical protein
MTYYIQPLAISGYKCGKNYKGLNVMTYYSTLTATTTTTIFTIIST